MLKINEKFSVADFVKLGRTKIKEIVSKNKIPIVVGGTGLYVNSLLNEINFVENSNDNEIKQKINEDLANFGSEFLLKKLQQTDPAYAAKLHPNNVKRIVRALELNLTTGLTMEQISNLSLTKNKKFNVCYIGLNYLDRNKLYSAIETRVNKMVEEGLLNEARKILEKANKNSTSCQAIGYKEFVPFFENKIGLEQAISEIKKNTKHFAKRQLTWFKKNDKINWLFLDQFSLEEIKTKILNLFKNHFKLK